MSTLQYSKDYYSSIKGDSDRSANLVAPLIFQMFQPQSLIDVGCGCGTWTAALKKAGIPSVMGIDGDYVKLEQLLIKPEEFQRRNLLQPLNLDKKFDLALCLEVAEHLEGSRADSFVRDLTSLADLVVFSAAIPGQGGTHHVNEQWPSYWISRFTANGFKAVDCLRPQIWNITEVAWWYKQNMFVFAKEGTLSKYSALSKYVDSVMPANLVHPQAYETATVPELMSPRMIKQLALAIPHFPAKLMGKQ